MSTERAGGWDFAALLRQRRRAAGLTQAELASLAGLAVRTVRDMERGRTTRPQRTTGVLLADALGLTGEERTGFLGAARGEATPVAVPHPRAAEAPPGSPARPGLPAAGPELRGREGELGQLVGLLTGLTGAAGSGPLALVGVAGVGKTALALAVAHRVAGQSPGSVGWVAVDQLAPGPELLTAAGVSGLSRPALVVIDGVDRSPAAVRSALGQLPPELRVLTTGRAPLGVPGERVWPVAPLALPPAGATELAEVSGYPAAALFLDRLALVRPQPPAADEVPALVGLVRRLGGLPLALELAAAHGRLLRLPEILQRYGDRVLDLAGGDGEATLREGVAGSYQLLGAAEQDALRRLAAFRDWWSVELAEQLLAEGGRLVVSDPMPVLDRLVSMGLVGVREAREHRFRLLDVVRDFATEQAERRGELVIARRAHAAVVARLVARTAGMLAGPDLPAAMARLDEVSGEVWAALNHAANDDPHTALRLAAMLPRWWRFRGRDVAGRRWLHRLLDDPRTGDTDPAVRAWAGVGLARLALAHGDGPAEAPAAEAALAEFRRLRDVDGELAAGSVLSAVCRAAGRYDEARAHAQAGLAVASRHGRVREAAVGEVRLAWHEVRLGHPAAARRRLAVADRLAAQSGEQRLRVLAAAQLAELDRLEGRYEDAVAIGQRVLARIGELGDPAHRRRVLGTLGQALVGAGRLAEAERVLASLRGPDPAARTPAVKGWCAAIEARLALAGGDRSRAVEWFTAAVAAFRAGDDLRLLVEALVELAAWVPRPGPVLAELARVCRAGGFVLLERERHTVAQVDPGNPLG
jgi:predicted ATPase/transcriptional regulator with XRE-family HTH domain